MRKKALLFVPILLLAGCTKSYNPLDATSIEVTGYSNVFKCGDAYSFDGEIKATYKDGTIRTLKSNEYTIDHSSFIPFSMNEANITISYGEQKFEYSITKEKRDSFKILMIGNSFSDDTETYLYPLAAHYGLNQSNTKVADLYIGGCTIDTHVDNAKKDNKAYVYRDWYGAASNDTYNVSIKEALQKEEWDIITLQQASGSSGMKDSYSNLQYLVNYVKNNIKNKNATIAWLQTWAYAQDSTHEEFSKYHNDQHEMYTAICDAYKEKVKPIEEIVDLIPVGTAIQNAREGAFGDTLNRDGYHLSIPTGRFIAGLTAFCAITGYEAKDVTVFPDEYSEEEKQCIFDSVKNALSNRLSITK